MVISHTEPTIMRDNNGCVNNVASSPDTATVGAAAGAGSGRPCAASRSIACISASASSVRPPAPSPPATSRRLFPTYQPLPPPPPETVHKKTGAERAQPHSHKRRGNERGVLRQRREAGLQGHAEHGAGQINVKTIKKHSDADQKHDAAVEWADRKPIEPAAAVD